MNDDADDPTANDPSPSAGAPSPKPASSRTPRRQPGQPLELVEEEGIQDIGDEPVSEKHWYILKCQVNRETSIRDNLLRKIAIEKMERHFGDVVIPTQSEKVFTKAGKSRIVNKKIFAGYLVVQMAVNDESRGVIRDVEGISGFAGSQDDPPPLPPDEIARLLNKKPLEPDQETAEVVEPVTNIKVKEGERVRVTEGKFQNYEGDVSGIDLNNGIVTVMLTIFGRPTPVELKHWEVEKVV